MPESRVIEVDAIKVDGETRRRSDKSDMHGSGRPKNRFVAVSDRNLPTKACESTDPSPGRESMEHQIQNLSK